MGDRVVGGAGDGVGGLEVGEEGVDRGIKGGRGGEGIIEGSRR